MSTRVQVVLDVDEKAEFKTAAARAGMSMSAWFKECARLRLEEGGQVSLPDTGEKLRAFFAECDASESGDEPDWSEQKRIIQRSGTSGISDT